MENVCIPKLREAFPIFSKKNCKRTRYFTKPADSNGLIVVKLKQDLKCKSHIYSELVRSQIMYQELAYLKSHNKFYKDISITKSR